jgi:hypothetical protein
VHYSVGDVVEVEEAVGRALMALRRAVLAPEEPAEPPTASPTTPTESAEAPTPTAVTPAESAEAPTAEESAEAAPTATKKKRAA